MVTIQTLLTEASFFTVIKTILVEIKAHLLRAMLDKELLAVRSYQLIWMPGRLHSKYTSTRLKWRKRRKNFILDLE